MKNQKNTLESCSHFFARLTVVSLAFLPMVASATSNCEFNIGKVTMSQDQRALSGQNCLAKNVSYSNHGIGFGIVGSVDIVCKSKTNGASLVNSVLTYNFRLAPGSCEVVSVTQSEVNDWEKADLLTAHVAFCTRPVACCPYYDGCTAGK